MRRCLFITVFTFFSTAVFSQTTVFSDNFNTSTGAIYTNVSGPIGSSAVWTMARSGVDWGARIDGNILDLTNDATGVTNANVNGWTYANTPTASFLPPYNTTLGSNTSLVTWTFNMRQIRTDPSGFTVGSYGVAFLLGNNTGNGYAVMLGQTGTTDPIRLTRFAGGISSGTITNFITSNTSGLTDFGDEYLSIKVTYDPATNTWELFVRNDGTTAFADPTTGTLTSQGTAVDNTHTGISLTTMGGYWQGSTTSNQTAYFDNVKVVVGVPPTITTGTVTSPPFVLANCAATAAGTVDFTSAGTFNAGNTFTAQLSNDIGSFATPVSIGSISLSGVNPGGTINITIPAGTAGGTGYLIRVVSSDPAATGTSSSSFTITQNGVGGCSSSNTDYYRSVQSGNWWTASTWQSSPDNTNWITATQPPNFNANTILIQSSHTVSIDAASSADQLTIQNGAILDLITGGSLTVNDGSGDDITIASGGMFILSATAVPPTFSGSSTCVVSTGATLRVAATGMTGAGTGVNVNNFVYQHQSVLEYTPTAAFSTSGVTYFPNAASGVIPIFRASNTGAITVGAGTFTTFNGVFECVGGGVSWQSAGIKTFRNGIIGSGDMTALASSGTFVINGTTASLGGTGALIAPSTGMQIGATTTVTITSDKTVTGNISILADSYIDLGVFDLTLSGSISGGATNAYVRTNSTGSLILNSVDAAGKTFPVGDFQYNPILIENGSNHNWSVNVNDGVIADPPRGVTGAVSLTWNISPSVNPPAAGADITFQFDKINQVGVNFNTPPYNTPDNVQAWHRTQGYWLAAGTPTPLNLVAGNIWNVKVTGLTQFSPYALSRISLPLPVKLTEFSANKVSSGSAIVNWILESYCFSSTIFEIEKSYNGIDFSSIGSLPGNENSRYYFYNDTRLAKGTNWYRLKITEVDGKITYSKVIAIINDTKGLMITSVYPNPVSNAATVTLSAAKSGVADLQVYDISGTVVYRRRSAIAEGTNNLPIDLGKLPAGVYHLSVQSAESKAMYRLIKQ